MKIANASKKTELRETKQKWSENLCGNWTETTRCWDLFILFLIRRKYIDYTRVRPTFVCLFFYQLLARNKTKQASSPEKKKKYIRVCWIERRREKKQQHDENNEAKCVDDDWVSFFLKLFSRLRPLSLLRAPCVCAGGERERKSNNNNSKVHWPYTLRACCLCVCVVVCCGWQTERGTNARLCVETVGRAFWRAS
jgi:hypothetical protein